jgi:ribosomal protein S19
MSRSKWKGNILNFQNISNKIKKPIKIWKSNIVITKNSIGKTFLTYTGSIFKKFTVDRQKVGFKVGEFRFTRNRSQKKVTKLKNNKTKK